MRRTLEDVVEQEELRALRTGHWYSILRIAPVGWAAFEGEVELLEFVVTDNLRRCDFVVRRGDDREVAAVLVETGSGAEAAERIRVAAKDVIPNVQLRFGCAPAGPGQQWQEVWRLAGEALLMDAAVPAAA